MPHLTVSTEEPLMNATALMNRVRGEFLEMPDLRLTLDEAERLWGLDRAACEQVVDALVSAAFLRWTPNGKIVRAAA